MLQTLPLMRHAAVRAVIDDVEWGPLPVAKPALLLLPTGLLVWTPCPWMVAEVWMGSHCLQQARQLGVAQRNSGCHATCCYLLMMVLQTLVLASAALTLMHESFPTPEDRPQVPIYRSKG